MIQLYKKIQERGFRANESSINFLSYIYGENSKIIQHELETRAIRSGAATLGTCSQDADGEDDFYLPRKSRADIQRPLRLDRAHDLYWKNAQPLLLDSKGWYAPDNTLYFKFFDN